MKTEEIIPTTTLRDVLDLCLSKASIRRSPAAWEESISLFAECLGREPTVADVNERQFASLDEWIEKNRPDRKGEPFKKKRSATNTVHWMQKKHRRHLFRLWCYAQDLVGKDADQRHFRKPITHSEEYSRKKYAQSFGDAQLPYSSQSKKKWCREHRQPAPLPPLIPLKSLTADDSLMMLIRHYCAIRLVSSSNAVRYKYQIAYRHMQRAIGREPKISDLNEESITMMVGYVLNQPKGRSVATASSYQSRMRALWEYAARRRILADFPDIKKIKPPKRTPTGFTRKQLKTIFDACAKQEGTIAGIPSALWLRALLLTIFETGERVGAVLAIRFDWINFETGWLRIPAEFRKGKGEDKTWELDPKTLDAIRQIESPIRDLVFPWRLSRMTLWKKWGNMLSRAGLPHGRKWGFHAIRKSSASFLKAAGGDAQSHLGHTTSQMSEAYLVPEIVGQQKAGALLFRPDEDEGDRPAKS